MPDTQRLSDWTLPDHTKVTRLDYYGQPYEGYERINRLPDYGKLWKSFSEQFRNQEERKPGHDSYNPPLDQIEWKETNPITL